jgi:flagellar hook-basal body complex protein FliE
VSIIPPISALPPMPSMPTAPLGSLGLPSSESTTRASEASNVGPADFAGALANAIDGLNTRMNGAERLSEAVATGQIADPTAALVEIEKADLAFNTAVQVRNRLIEGWQELSRMTV